MIKYQSLDEWMNDYTLLKNEINTNTTNIKEYMW